MDYQHGAAAALQDGFRLQHRMASSQLLCLNDILHFRSQEALDLLSLLTHHNQDPLNTCFPKVVDYMCYHRESAYGVENLWDCRLHAGTFPCRENHRSC